MAEEIADDAAARSTRAKDMTFDSAGTFACEGAPASPEAIEVMDEIDLDLSRHKAQQFTRELAQWADIILAMEAKHIEEMQAMAPDEEDKMHTILGFAAGIEGYPGETGYDITDPYRDPIEDYRETRDQIAAAVEQVLMKLDTAE
jgi:protein-tyrosine phosphatase